MKLCDGVYAYIWRGTFENNSNMFYFADPLNILFDPGLKNYLDLRLEQMKEDGLNPDEIKYVVNTHCHPDHFEGSQYFMEKGIPIVMHEDEIVFLNEIGPDFFSMMGMNFPTLKFDKELKEGKWRVNDIDLEIYLTPGHSPGSICIYWPEKKALVCGDLIFNQSVGRVDFPGGDGMKLKESVVKISKLDLEILLPGHMDMIQGKEDLQKNFELIKNYVLNYM